MEITPELLLKGKPTIIKGKEYLPTKDYVQPFFDEMSKFTDKFIINVQTPDQYTLTDGNEDITYNRVWVQAVMPDKYTIDNHAEVYSLLYGLDVRTPVYKVSRHYLNQACLNLCIFNPQWLSVTELQEGETFKYSIKNLMEATNDVEMRLRKMKNTFLDRDPDSRHKVLGEHIEKVMTIKWSNIAGKTQLSTNTAIDAYKSVYVDDRSPYYVKDTEECSVFNYYNAYTELIRDSKNFFNNIESTLLLQALFNID